MENKWIDVKKELPEADEKVLVWVKYEGDEEFEWGDSELDYYQDGRLYIEPNSQRSWLMGSATNYVITHWMRIGTP